MLTPDLRGGNNSCRGDRWGRDDHFIDHDSKPVFRVPRHRSNDRYNLQLSDGWSVSTKKQSAHASTKTRLDFATPQAMAGDLKPPSANYIQPGKRPLSSSSPVIVESSNGTFYVTLGAAGGHRILTTVVQLLLNLLDHHMPPEDALREPRMHDALLPNETSLELGGRGTLGFSNETAAFLQSLGHHISYVEPTKSAAHIILRKFDGTFEAAAEPRHPRSGAGSSQTPREKQEI